MYPAVAVDPMDIFDPPDRETMRLQKFGKLLAGPNTDLGEAGYCIITVLHVHVYTCTCSDMLSYIAPDNQVETLALPCFVLICMGV